jgi:hypothetical protein
MADPIPLAELELRILMLPPVSRGAHLGGPAIHARRLVQLWRGGEMTPSEIGKASADELIARRTVIGGDSAEAKAIDTTLRAQQNQAILEAHLRCSTCNGRPAIQAQGDSYFVRCTCGEEEFFSRAELVRILLAAPTKPPPPPERPRPSDRADYWGDDDDPLSQAFRLLGVEAVARAILRTALMSDHDYPNDSVHWPLPPFKHLLSELNEATWQAVLDGELQIEAIQYERGKIGEIPCVVSPIELARLSPDWKLSRLCRGDLDEFIEARVRRAPTETPIETPAEPPLETSAEPPAEPPAETLIEPADGPPIELPDETPIETFVEPPKRYYPSQAQLKKAMEEIDQRHPKDARPPPFKKIEETLKIQYPGVTQGQMRDALNYAPRLRGQRGRPPKLSD